MYITPGAIMAPTLSMEAVLHKLKHVHVVEGDTFFPSDSCFSCQVTSSLVSMRRLHRLRYG